MPHANHCRHRVHPGCGPGGCLNLFVGRQAVERVLGKEKTTSGGMHVNRRFVDEFGDEALFEADAASGITF